MPLVGWATVIISLIILAIVALGLIRVILHLIHVRATLRAVTGGVAAVDQLTATVPARLSSVNANLQPVRDFCETV
jgi:hypothetical protein